MQCHRNTYIVYYVSRLCCILYIFCLTIVSWVGPNNVLFKQFTLVVQNIGERQIANVGILIIIWFLCRCSFIVQDIVIQLTSGTYIDSSSNLSPTSAPQHYTCPTYNLATGATSNICIYLSFVSPSLLSFRLTLETFTAATPNGSPSQNYVAMTLSKAICITL